MKIYIIRHGESYSNTQGRMMSLTDLPLTEKGRQQALSAGPYLKKLYAGKEPDKIFSSDLKRANETVRLASGCEEIIVTPLVREMDLGVLEGMTWEERYSKYAHISLETGLSEAKMPGGESFFEVKERCRRFIDTYLRPMPDDASVLIGTHGICMRVLTNLLMGKDDSAVNYINWPDNTSVTLIDYCCDGSRAPKLILLNERGHLFDSGLATEESDEYRLFTDVDYAGI